MSPQVANFWVKGTWGWNQSSLKTLGETSYSLPPGHWMTFYAGPLSDALAEQWADNGDIMYSVTDADGEYGGVLTLYVQASGSAYGKINFTDPDGATYSTISIHAPHTWQENLPLTRGYSIHVKHS